ncbi:hypothetical protein CTI14_51565 [Methylobacterium radiotolerans]|nr:hypothetical protein CTI14_51565 [Methylobacterium radiotolerans]
MTAGFIAGPSSVAVGANGNGPLNCRFSCAAYDILTLVERARDSFDSQPEPQAAEQTAEA